MSKLDAIRMVGLCSNLFGAKSSATMNDLFSQGLIRSMTGYKCLVQLSFLV